MAGAVRSASDFASTRNVPRPGPQVRRSGRKLAHLYTAGSGEGAFGEKLAYFRFSQGLEQKIDAFLEADPDQPEPPSRAELGSDLRAAAAKLHVHIA